MSDLTSWDEKKAKKMWLIEMQCEAYKAENKALRVIFP